MSTTTETANDGPDVGAFEGVRVVELAEWVFVPVAGTLLADWGADVVHVERVAGDPYRGLATQGIGADRDGVNLSMAMANRGKRSLALDVQRATGREVLERLIATADVFISSLRPDALARLGLDAERLTTDHPRLVVACGHGFGARGPDANQAGYDSSAFFARGGLAHLLTPPDRDYPIGQRGAMGDRNGAMALAFGIASALLRRERTGRGGVVDVSLLATAMWTVASDVLTALGGGEPPRSSGDRTRTPNPLVGNYRTSDGRFVALVFLQGDRYWAELCAVLGRDDLAADERFADMSSRYEHRAACIAELDAEFGRRTFAECKELLGRLDAPWAPVQSIEELLDDPQVIANDYVGTVVDDGVPEYRLPTGPVQFDRRAPVLRRAPELGEHTESILLELGYDWEQIDALDADGVIP